MTQPSDPARPPNVRVDVELRLRFPLGAHTADGRFTVLWHVLGSPENGIYTAGDTRGLSDARYLATLGTRQTVPYDEVRRALALDTPGLAPLAYVGPLETGEYPLAIDALIEPMPDGARSHEWMPAPWSLPAALTLGIAVARVLAEARRRGLALAGLRPQTVWVAGPPDHPRLTALTPRAERFWQTATRLDYGVPPAYDDLYAAPEWLGGHEPDAASDVFSLCATLAWWLTGAHPFEGRNLMEQADAVLAGRRALWHGPDALRELIDRGLARWPRERASLPEVLAGLRACAADLGAAGAL